MNVLYIGLCQWMDHLLHLTSALTWSILSSLIFVMMLENWPFPTKISVSTKRMNRNLFSCGLLFLASVMYFFEGVPYHVLPTATYDVQSVVPDPRRDNKMNITVQFAENTTAKGFFIVLQNVSEPPDLFIAVLTSDSPTTATIDSIPPSMYTMFVYDLEEKGLPNECPAYKHYDSITISGNGEFFYLCQASHVFCLYFSS